ncbi:VWA domain-containing protein [Teredinibacter sp. KSP-S5-2]|uniref:VWA domain-containing protein n=1 Tax=Teredinibacter sp. KSP-S5-2 TaxID=3034506 RepID=UPI002934BA32|nr:VWA domain-containing protein [Teredinibacter sp. KSP-S5-2]WNO10322.1 VWA domain-containing protein [Teredinibacter sp. KSP-S5-2]
MKANILNKHSWKRLLGLVLALTLVTGCGEETQTKQYSQGIYLLLDTSGTYTQELSKAKQIINYMLAMMEPGDTFTVARIDSASFSEKDIVAKVVLDARPSVSNKQKREFAATIDAFVQEVKSSAYTDISGGLLQAIEHLNEASVAKKTIMIYSDLKEDLPKGYVREFDMPLDGFQVKALNVTKLRADNLNPQEYLDRVEYWRYKVEQGGGRWTVINDLDKPEAITL